MGLLFVHFGEKVKKDVAGNIYTDGSYNMKIWERYLALFDKITLLMREDKKVYSEEEARRRFNPIDTSRISFTAVPDTLASLKAYIDMSMRTERQKIVQAAISQAEAVIIRLPGAEWVLDCVKKANKPYLVEVVGCPFDSLWNHSLKGRVLAIPAYLKLKKAMKDTSHAIYVTNEFLQKRYPTKGKQIGCSDVQISAKTRDRTRVFRKQGKESDGILRIGTAAATDVKYKGQQYVIMALAQLKKAQKNRFVYQIAGNGDTAYLRTLVQKYSLQDCIEFMGSIPREKMEEWYSGLDIYVQPSKQEGLPRALVEAMSVGIPCIGSNVGGIPELLDDESIFSKGNIRSLSERLISFTDSSFREEKAALCYNKSLEYDEEILARKRSEFMREALLDAQNMGNDLQLEQN